MPSLLRSGAAFYRGLGASMLGIAPYMGLELASYDLLPKTMPSFARGFLAVRGHSTHLAREAGWVVDRMLPARHLREAEWCVHCSSRFQSSLPLWQAFIATVSCYPLDTVRRRIQLQAATRVSWGAAASAILREDGIGGMYRGFLPNALKVCLQLAMTCQRREQ